MEGDSVTLSTDDTKKHDDYILWKFGAEKSLIAQIRKEDGIFSTYNDVPDGRFRDRLKLDNQTGSLTITNITTQHAGLYQQEITGAKQSSQIFSVSVYDEITYAEPTFYKRNTQKSWQKQPSNNNLPYKA
ncbi:hypothetical protein cypCar_00034327 [Cyprinus carpio]|nr:hypothetical protein cypCar_00034327 [Cyprinus carpio]